MSLLGADGAVNAVVNWAAATCSIDSTYPQLSGAKDKALPDLMADLTDDRLVQEDRLNFPGFRIQQAWLRVYLVTASVMVDNADPEAAAQLLRSYDDLLVVALLNDATLSNRVPIASPLVTFDHARPFVEYQDGTVGREMTMQIRVAEPLEVI